MHGDRPRSRPVAIAGEPMLHYPRRQRRKMEWLGYSYFEDSTFPLEDKWAARLEELEVVVRERDGRKPGWGMYHLTPQGRLDCDRLTRLPQ